jgi:Ca2+-transporting ATPase
MLTTVAVQAAGIFLAVAGAFLAALASMNKGSTFFYTGSLDKVMPIDVARTVAFATLICAELFRAFAARSERISVFKLGLFSNKMMNGSVGLSILLLLAVIYIPGVNGIFDNVMISPMAWLIILPLAFVPFILNEAVKAIKNNLHK